VLYLAKVWECRAVGEKNLFAQCLEASQGILARWGWRLLAAEELAQRAEAHLMGSGRGAVTSLQIIRHAALRLYGHELYQACGHQDVAIRERAFTELWNYLYPIALYRAEDAAMAQDATQETLLTVWEKRTQCRDPHSFLNWATMIVINQVRAVFRRVSMIAPGEGERQPGEDGAPRWQRREVLMADLRGDEQDSEREDVQFELVEEAGPERALLRRESQAQLVAALERALRSPRQRRVIIGLFIEEKGVLELARELDTTPTNVYTLKSRALARLGRDRDFKETLADLLKGSEE
jgi:RNA polymerase sigma factor (sigma-70 family)